MIVNFFNFSTVKKDIKIETIINVFIKLALSPINIETIKREI